MNYREILGWIVALLFIIIWLFERKCRYTQLRRAEKNRHAVIQRAIQLISHEMRKPLSMTRMTLDMLKRAENQSHMQKILLRAFPDIQRAITLINGLISDLAEVTFQTELAKTDASPITLIEQALLDAFALSTNCNIKIKYSFLHNTTIQVDSPKFTRVLSHIFTNAVEANQGQGTIEISTKNLGNSVEFELHNDGPAISSTVLPHIFEDFFIAENKTSIGVGLTFARKVIESHGGRIRCENPPSGGATFWLTVPAGLAPENPLEHSLPDSSAKFGKHEIERSSDSSEEMLETAIIAKLCRRAEKPRILLVDDESLYRNALRSHLQKEPAIWGNIVFCEAANSAQALSIQGTLALAIIDIDLEENSLDGFALVQKLRENGMRGVVCIHSNRFLVGDQKYALNVGADAFFPKPMSRTQMLSLLLQALGDEKSESQFNLALVDDDELNHLFWQECHPRLRVFSTPEAFMTAVQEDINWFSSLDAVIIDHYYAPKSQLTGIDIAQWLTAKNLKTHLFLASNIQFAEPNIRSLFTAQIGKSVLSETQLKALTKNPT